MIALVWNWYEVIEGFATGVVTGILFVVVPVVIQLNRHHRVSMAAHAKTHKQVGVE